MAAGINAHRLKGNSPAESLAELSIKLGIDLEVNLEKSRCSKCNSPIQRAEKQSVINKVEPNTLKYYEEFWECPKCGQVYWQGAHWSRIRAILDEAKKLKQNQI